ncbi:unnamed protein product [Pylaiella littoralis]
MSDSAPRGDKRDVSRDVSRYPYMNFIHEGLTRTPAEMRCDGVGDTLSRKDEVLLHSVLHWYNQDGCRVQTFSDIVSHRNGLSLRIIDWLTTNFSKRFNVAIESDGFPRNLRRDYHKNLTAHNKKNFDPFARRRRIIILLFGRERRVSTIGQLNFFRWFLTKNLCGFLLENKAVIEKHMKECENNHGKAVGRSALECYAPRVYAGPFTMSF